MADVGTLEEPLAERAAPASLFASHLEGVAQRTARALEACGYSALLVHSGSLLPIFEDDRTYPFEVHAPFKVWAPLLEVPDCFLYFEPGRRPVLTFHQPDDYWHKPAALPDGYWTRHFEIRSCRHREEARRALPRNLRGTAFLGDTLAELGSWGLVS